MSEYDYNKLIENGGLFDDVNINDAIDAEEIEPIDMDEIDKSSENNAKTIIENILELYYNKEFAEQNPRLKKRIETELESLRILIKIRKADEAAHDIIIKAISQKPSNASLYKSLTEVQKTVISVTTKIDECLKGLQTLLKNYQLELNFKEDENTDNNEEEESQNNSNTYRGTKNFIEQMMSNEKGD